MANGKSAQANCAAGGKAGIVVIVVLVALVVAGIAAMHAFGAATDARVAHVQDADGKTYDMPLSENAQLTVKTSEGENTIVVENGTVRVSQANCPNQDCVHQGEISTAGQQIVCLPHKLVVSISSGGDSNQQFDVVGS